MEKPTIKTTGGDLEEGTKLSSFAEIEELIVHHRVHRDLHCTYHLVAWRDSDPHELNVRVPALITRPSKSEPDEWDYVLKKFSLTGITDRFQAASRRLPGDGAWRWALEAHCQPHVAGDKNPGPGESLMTRSSVYLVSLNSQS